MSSSSNSVDVIIVGCGFAGICAGLQLQSKFKSARFEIFDKTADVGGTWSKNTYPNLSCDIPSQLYSFSFALNPDWTFEYATQRQIFDYLKHTARSLEPRIKLRQECVSCDWLEEAALWRVQFVDLATGKGYVRYCRFLITAVGFLDVPKGPESIVGIQDFKGHVFHSSSWDHEIDFQGKDVVVVGNGASATQFVPWIVNNVDIRSLTQIVRSEQWVAPKKNKAIGRFRKWVFRNLPSVNRLYHSWLALKLDLAFVAFRDTLLGRHIRSVLEASLSTYVKRTAPPEYHDILIPSYSFGSKRPILDHGYLTCLNNPKVTLVKSKNTAVVGPNRLADDKGSVHPADILILANGFKTQQLLSPMRITGLDGTDLRSLWEHNGTSAYMGVMVSGFPNLFLLAGPNTLPSGHSTLLGIEHSVAYILRLLKPLLSPKSTSSRTKLSSIEVKSDAQAAFNSDLESRLNGLVYTASVSSWYIDERTGKNSLVWPGTQLEFWWSRCVKKIAWTDFTIRDVYLE